MKTMTCKDLGGPCDFKLTAETSEEMMKIGEEHMNNVKDEAHTKAVMEMRDMSPQERKKWMKTFMWKWDNVPEDGEQK